VEFVVASDRLSPSELTNRIGSEPDAAASGTAHHPKQATWELRTAGSGESDLTSLIDGVFERIAPAKEALASICDEGQTTCLLRIIQYVRDEEVGPGFYLGPEKVRLLASLGAFIDVDQYWVPPDERP
jgi:hypothetical protein